jgi:SWI/SNF-related matrix-associated actin-dependent regulator 1 of chromatin subfamily A
MTDIHLRKFQAQDEDRVWNDYGGRAIVSWVMGLGKGVLALDSIDRFVPDGPTVIVCPAGLKEHWKRESDTHLGRRAEVLSETMPKVSGLPGGPRIWIVNYDILRARAGTRNRPTWLKLLKEIGPRLVVIDECHKIKNWAAKQSKAVRELCVDVPNVLALSGTPLESKPIELWHILSIVKPSLFPSRFLYGMRYCDGKNMPWGWDFNGASHLDELNAILTGPDGCVVRRRREDVLDQLPPLTRTVLPFDLPAGKARDYDFAAKDFIAWLLEKDEGKARRALFAERMARVGYLKRLAAEYKLPMATEWVRDFLDTTGRKLLVFGIHRFALDHLFEAFRDRAVLVTGDVTGPNRQAAYDRFNRDPKCTLFVGNIHAAGMGWPCQSASDVAFVEMDWKPASHEQAIDRTRGINRGTGDPVNAYYLVANDTIEVDLCDILEKRQWVLDAVLDGGETVSDNLFGLLEAAVVARGGGKPKRRKIRSL